MECRTCLASGVQLINLDAKLQDSQNASNDAENTITTLLDCLLFCTRLEKVENFSNSICIECSRALKVSFIFIKNALTANAIQLQRASQSIKRDVAQPTTNKSEQSSGVKFRCKICQEKLNSKKALKDHVKLHMDVITYRCQLCDFDCKKRTHLSDHYSNEHNTEATSAQLKPLMQQVTMGNKENGGAETQQEFQLENDGQEPPTKSIRLMDLEERKREEEEAQRLLQELEESLSHEQQPAILTVTDAGEYQTIDELGSVTVALDHLAANIMTEDTLNFGSEYVMLPDGTVQKVDGAGIVIEYIEEEIVNDGVTFLDGNDLVVDNTIQIDANCNTDLLNAPVDEIIEEPVIENSYNGIGALNKLSKSSAQNTELPSTSSDTFNKQNYCKICNQVFGTRSELKIHMLGHSEIPHFFCDRCSFYTFFKNDLKQHYKSKHHVHPSSKQLQPRNKNDTTLGMQVYTCDLCFFETSIRLDLQHHYLRAHKVVANDVQLRPTIDKTDIEMKQNIINKRHDFRALAKASHSRTIICKLCGSKFNSQREYRQHLLWHKQEKKNEALRRLLETNAEDIQKEVSAKLQQSQTINNQAQYKVAMVSTTSTTTAATTAPMEVSMPNTMTTNELYENNVVYQQQQSQEVTPEQQQQPQLLQQNYMQIENNVILPMEAIPQVIASEQTIAPDGGMEFDFNGDDIFEDFDRVNDNNDEQDDEVGNLVLTSEDDLDDLIEENGSNNDTKKIANSNVNCGGTAATKQQHLSAYCVQCNKRFFSQYQFENHMFLHRGLAPYRCELCTNIYNTKRALIKHFKAVHKRMPTRDMIQAKGDKVEPQLDAALLDFDFMKAGTLMCAKCPFESTELLNLQLHLSNTHGITDQNFVLQKLPFECTRCVRSFETKPRLIRHLERNHSTQPILEQTLKPNKNANAAETVETAAAATATTASTAYNAILSGRQEQQQQQQYNHDQSQHQQAALIEPAASTTSGKVCSTAETSNQPNTNHKLKESLDNDS